MSAVMRPVLGLCFAVALAACSGGGSDRLAGSSASPPPPDANVAEQARLKLIDRCMMDASITAPPRDKRGKAPRCQCYGNVVAQKLSPSEQSYYLSTGGLPMSINTGEIVGTCSRA